jgi:heme/copper-type cytochrome/quinol oxidase subunit 4
MNPATWNVDPALAFVVGFLVGVGFTLVAIWPVIYALVRKLTAATRGDRATTKEG